MLSDVQARLRCYVEQWPQRIIDYILPNAYSKHLRCAINGSKRIKVEATYISYLYIKFEMGYKIYNKLQFVNIFELIFSEFFFKTKFRFGLGFLIRFLYRVSSFIEPSDYCKKLLGNNYWRKFGIFFFFNYASVFKHVCLALK